MTAVCGLAASSVWLIGLSIHSQASTRDREVTRLQRHFDTVDPELRQADTSALTPAQYARRVALVGWLREYRDQALFPTNDVSSQPVPLFRDRRGALCAMAYLIARSGRSDIVDRIAATRNEAFIRELASDPELAAWLDSVGLSVAEAARIQPTYGCHQLFISPPCPNEDDSASTTYKVASVAASTASAATLGLNLVAPTRTKGWIGLYVGGATILTGVAGLTDGRATDFGAVNVVAGAGDVMAGLFALRNTPPVAQPSGRTATNGLAVSVLPTVVPGRTAALVVRATF
jgi:hypothetical protein